MIKQLRRETRVKAEDAIKAIPRNKI